MVALALDIGETRIGIAVSSRDGKMAMPVKVLPAAEVTGMAKTFRYLVEDYEPDILVSGRPLTMAGEPGPQAERVAAVAQKIADELGLPLVFEDERLSWIYENLRDYILAVENNRLLGCGALHFVWDRFAEIRSLAVEPSLQKTGIGRQLVEHLEKEGIERGVTMFFHSDLSAGIFAKCDYIETAKDKLPQKVWKECVYCPQYPYCNEIAFIKTTVDYEPSQIKF